MRSPAALKTLILTEKPSVARDFAKALGVKGKQDGYMESDAYVITWAIGHLVELLEPHAYDPRWKSWRLDTLPILPETFQYKPIAKTRKQLRIIRNLLKTHGTAPIVIATDAGREGEVIARTILQHAGTADPQRLRRFWTSQALTPGVIREEMSRCGSASNFDRLWRAGQARQIADWLIGMNGTRAATKQAGAGKRWAGKGQMKKNLFSVGRVQTAVLALIVDRRREREHFRPEPYWLLRVRFVNEKGDWWGSWFRKKQTRFPEETAAQEVAGKVTGVSGTVRSVRKQKKKEPPPPLYALTDLQRDANKWYGFSAKMTLGIAQDLYEKKKCLSYPRTDARVLGSKTVDLARKLVNDLSGVYPQPFAGVRHELIDGSNRRVFNDARLTDHHALIPLKGLPASATPSEEKIYQLVLKRFAAVFHPDCEFEQTEIITEAAEETFRTRGKRILKPGWRAVYPDSGGKQKKSDDADEPEAEDLPPLAQGDPANAADVNVIKKMTQPPPEYSEALLLKEMTNPGRYVTEDELKKIYRGDVGLGTQATRAQIIETLLSRQYVFRQKKHLIATDKGCQLIDTLRRFGAARVLTSPEETARWEMALERIAQGEGSETAFLDGIKQLVRTMVEEFKNGKAAAGTESAKTGPGTATDLGICPACGGKMIEGKRGYGCSNWRDADGRCRCIVWKEIAGRQMSPEEAKTLVEKRELGPLDGFVSKKGKPFSAKLRLEQGEDGNWGTVFVFDDQPGEKESLGKCPACGGDVVDGPKGYGCANWREESGGCRFVIWKTVAQKELTPEVAKQLLERGTTDELFGFISRKGNAFSARLKLQEEGGVWKVAFEFPPR